MTNSARLSGRPSSSAAYNVDDVVDTPDSAIKSWRYLGAGEWEPNDAVRYTMVPGGGIEVCVGDIRATIPELTAAQSAATLAAAEAAFAPQIVTGYYYVKVGGTRTSGKSTADDWSDANCYGSIQAAINQPWNRWDEIVLSDEVHTTAGTLSFTGSAATDGATIRIRSNSRNPETCVISSSAAGTALAFNKAGVSYGITWERVKFKRSTTLTSSTGSLFASLSTPTLDILFDGCVIEDFVANIDGPYTYSLIYAGSGTVERELRFRDCVFRNIQSSARQGWAFMSGGSVGTSVVFERTKFFDIVHAQTDATVTFTGGIGLSGAAGLSFIDCEIDGLHYSHPATTEVAVNGFVRSLCPLTVSGLVAKNVTLTGGNAGCFLLQAERSYQIENVRVENSYSQPGPAVNSVGGAILAYGTQAVGTVRDAEIDGCVSDYGPLVYASQGGALDAKSIRAYNSSARVEGIIYSGGWGDMSVIGFLLVDCVAGLEARYGLTDYAAGIYAHLHTAGDRAKTVVVKHGVVINTVTQTENGAATLHLENNNTAFPMTVTVENVAADAAAAQHARMVVGAGAAMTVSGTGNAFRGGSSMALPSATGTLTGSLGEIADLAQIGDGTLTAATIDRDLARAWTEAMADAT